MDVHAPLPCEGTGAGAWGAELVHKILLTVLDAHAAIPYEGAGAGEWGHVV